MLKMTMELKIKSLYTFYGRQEPGDEAVDAFYAMLGNLPEEALDHAIAEFRENHAKIQVGENVGFTLKKYARSWHKPAEPRTISACPHGCHNGMFYVRPQGYQGAFYVAPCAHCSPDMANAATRSMLETSGATVLDIAAVTSGDIHATHRNC